MFKGLCEVMDGSPSRQVTILPCLMATGLVRMGIVIVENDIYSSSRDLARPRNQSVE